MGQRGGTDFRQFDENVMLQSKDSAAQSAARQKIDRVAFWVLGLTPGLVFTQTLRNNVSWRQGSKMASSCTVCTYTMVTFTNISISVF